MCLPSCARQSRTPPPALWQAAGNPKDGATPRYYACTTGRRYIGTQSNEPRRIDKGKATPRVQSAMLENVGLHTSRDKENGNIGQSKSGTGSGDRARTPVFTPISARPRGELTRWAAKSLSVIDYQSGPLPSKICGFGRHRYRRRLRMDGP